MINIPKRILAISEGLQAGIQGNKMCDPIDNILSNFNSGVKSGLERAKDTGDWISVDTPPEKNGKVLISFETRHSGNKVILAQYQEDTFFPVESGYKTIKKDRITHWQYLPEPPNA